MIKRLPFFAVAFIGLFHTASHAQISAGPDVTICSPGSTVLTATLPPTTVGTTVSLTDDQYTGVVNLGFTFTYFGTNYTQCVISSNNYITFNTAVAGGWSPWSINSAIPSAANPTNSIMCPWQDLLPPSGGTITYATMGTAPNRVFVVAFCSVAMFSCTNLNFTSQIKLFEGSNRIETHIANKPLCASWNNGRAIHGIQNNAGTVAYVVPGRNFPTQWTCTNDGYQFTPTGPATYSQGVIPYSPVILASSLNPVQWYIGATLVGTGNSITVSPSTTTVYTATVTGGCVGVSSDQVTVTVSNPNVNAGASVTVCQGGSTQLNATSTSTIVSWSWTPAGSLNNATIQNPVATPVNTTTYVVTATDNFGCTATSSVVITLVPMQTADAGPNDSICTGSCATLTASGGNSYQWTANPSITSALNNASITACPTSTTVYYVQVTDINGCVGNDSVTVFVAPTTLSVSIFFTNVTCGGACDGGASAVPVGGFLPYTYSWSNMMTGPFLNGLCAGSYTTTVTDVIGCTATASAIITTPLPLDVQASNITTANCGQNDGSITITIAGGTGGYSILWPSGNSGLSESNLPPGQVCVTVTDGNGCDTVVCFNIPNTPGVATSVSSSNNVTCFGACDGDATATGVGGTQPYNYTWSSVPAQLTPTATNLCPGTYTVTMNDANGCSDTATVTITEPPQLTLVLSTAATICIGQSANLTAQGNGGTPGYNYAWTDGVNNWIVQNPTVSPTVTTTYSCIVTDANMCTSSIQSVTITVNPPLSVNAIATQVVCQNTQVNLSAVAGGGNGNYTYTWTPGPLMGANVTVTAIQNQQYTVTVTDNCGTPLATDTVSVLINPAPVPTFTTVGPAQGCEPLCVDFVNTTPNTASLTWTLTGGTPASSTSSPATSCFNVAGSYDVQLTVTDNIGCTGTTTMLNYVTVYPNPIADFTANPNPATELNNIVQYTDLSIGAVSWIWSFGPDDSASFVQNPLYTWADTGTFMVQLIVENSWGCQDSITIPQVIQEDYALFIPNTFTPNGDGHNDLFFPQGIGIDEQNYMMYIFDRWGNLIYQTSVWPGGWDGTVQGKGECQVDTYVYKITTQDANRAKRVYIGHVNLIR